MELKQPVTKTKILIETGNPEILAPLCTTAKTEKQANCRSTVEWIHDGVHVYSAISSRGQDPVDVGNLASGSSAFSKTSLNIWKFMVHIL